MKTPLSLPPHSIRQEDSYSPGWLLTAPAKDEPKPLVFLPQTPLPLVL